MTARSEPPADRGILFESKQKLFPSRKPPIQVATQAAHVRDRKYGGNVAAMAAAYNVAPRTVYRWLSGARKKLSTEHRAQLQEEVTQVQTTPRGRERRAREYEGLPSSGHSAWISRATSFTVRGSDGVRPRDIDLSLTGDEVAALTRAETEEEAHSIIGGAVARYFNNDSVYSRFSAEDFDFNTNDFQLR